MIREGKSRPEAGVPTRQAIHRPRRKAEVRDVRPLCPPLWVDCHRETLFLEVSWWAIALSIPCNTMPDRQQRRPEKSASELMIGSWKIGAQLSTSHSFRDSLDPLSMVETVRRVQEEIDLDLLIVGFREAPGVFRKFCGSDRPVGDAFLWYGAPFRHRRHGGFGPRRELARRKQPGLARLGREWRRSGGELPLRVPEQSGGPREGGSAASRTPRPV